MTKHDDDYEDGLAVLQIALVKAQIRAIDKGERLVVVMEGRDGAGKDGAIKRLTEHLGVRNTRTVSLPKPSDREHTEWWFQRYVRYLPAAGEWVIFNRSWYNRAGVEPVMGFCTKREHEDFLRDAPNFEALLTQSGIRLVKYWLDISKDEQSARLEDRRTDPLKALKTSPMDLEAQKRWKDYSAARNEMLLRTHSAVAPWWCVHTDDKKKARLAILSHLLRQLDPDAQTPAADPKVLYAFDAEAVTDGRLEP